MRSYSGRLLGTVVGDHMKSAEAFKIISEAVSNGVINFDDPVGFSNFLCSTYYGHIFPDLLEADQSFLSGTDYKKAFRKYMHIVAPYGLLAFRGLHQIYAENVHDLLAQISDTREHHTSWSMNVAAASGGFSFAPYCHSRSQVGAMVEETIPYNLDFARPSNRDRNAMFDQKCRKLGTGVLFVARIPQKYLISFGGDGESGPMQEAEVHVKSTLPDKYIEHIFARSPFALDAVFVTEEERKKYCLDFYYDNRPKYLHGLVDCDLPGFKLVTEPKDVHKDLAKHRWYRLV